MTDQSSSQPNVEQLTSTRTRSSVRGDKPSRQNLHRVYSAGYLDDRSVYHDEAAAGASDTTDNGPNDQDLEGSEHSIRDVEKDIDIIPEVRNGIPDERDVEKGQPVLEKTQSSRSKKDPNIVW